ncbi:hypothetical protein U728_919 [Clostridium botulinum 202F]|nr:hypothetical protein U728_919 [Clostridium botulinum 202F]KON13354.1 hypothetical protein ACP50_04535 [Clostridium botulinum]MBY6987709.1 hypothetical protein [Clostridium botulinum]NFH01642.1 hypothetical protein [Clostridium botulinum]NFP39422.1 hypothetical protein [Clostridium botulinum]
MSEEVHFEKLTPINDCKLGIYEKAMDFIFSDEDIVNVAVTAPYASGKSSMIESYKKKNSEKMFLHISLAHFNKNSKVEENESNEDNNYEKENRLEGKIINQLIHKIEPKYIPQTNFNIKEKIDKKDIVKKTIVSGIFIVLFLYIAYYNFWYITVSNMNKSILEISLNNEVLIISGCICFGIVSYCVYKAIENQRFNKYLKKLKIQGNEIEIFEDKEESYFDKYLNEVLYLFKNSKVDAIVFEDIDRYESVTIFEKLREISILVNSRCNKRIKFIYLLKDDMFTSKDRTKFFDYIISIVPVVDSSNSYDKFIEHFKKGKIFNLIDENFLKDISLYVDDMRLLKNIYNEFYIYHNKLEENNSNQSEAQKIKLDNNKLLGMIVYKNIFPRDFSDLQLGQGFVYCVLESKESVIFNEIKEINKEINLLEQENEDTKAEKLNSIDELDACFFNYDGEGELYLDNKKEHEFKDRLEFIKTIKKNNYECKEYNRGYYSNTDISTIFTKLENNEEYKKKKLLITNKLNNKIERNNEKIKELKNNCANIKGKYFKDVINRKNEEEIFKINYVNEIGEKNEFKEIKGSIYFPLIKYLIRNGYINENYSDYMTYFYPNSLTYSDKAFLLSIANRQAKEYSYKLINCKLILSRLRLSDFLEEEILNYNLLSYLLKNSNEYKEQLENFITNIKGNKFIDFVSTMFDKEDNENDKILFVKEFNNKWDEACDWIINEEKFDQKIKREYIQKTVLFSKNDDIEKNNEEILFECNENMSKSIIPITDYINEDDEFLNMKVENIEEFIKVLKLIEVKMNYINYDKSDKNLFKEVYRNQLYEINYDMMSLLLEKIYQIPRSDNYKEKNYSLIMSKEDEPLAKYINERINCYIKVILAEYPTQITDELKYALIIINNTELDDNFRNNYIKLLKTNIEKLKDINDTELWGVLIEKNIVDNTDENLLDYYFEKENKMDDVLIRFINNFKNDFNFKSDLIEETYGKDADDKLSTSIIRCNEIEDRKYFKLLERIDRYYEAFNVSNIDKSKISILIELQIIRMNAATLTFMRNNYKDNLMEYIVINIDKYLNKTLDGDNFEHDEMIKVIDENINEDQKIELISLTDKSISISKRSYPNKIKKYILENNFDESDLEYLINIFIDEDEDLKEIIRKIIVENIETVIEAEYSVGYKLLVELIDNEKINEDDKKKLIVISIKNLKNSKIYKCFEKLNMTDYMSLFNRKKPKFEINDINERLLSVLINKEIINKFDTYSEDDVEYYMANGKKLIDHEKGIVYDM